MKKPVYSLTVGDVLVAPGGSYIVDEVIPPTNDRCLGEIGQKPEVWKISATQGGHKRTFYYYGSRIVETKP